MASDSGRVVSISFSTKEERCEFAEYAAQKGMTLAALTKMALFQYRAKYALKMVKDSQTPKQEREAKTVQSYAISNGLGDGL